MNERVNWLCRERLLRETTDAAYSNSFHMKLQRENEEVTNLGKELGAKTCNEVRSRQLSKGLNLTIDMT